MHTISLLRFRVVVLSTLMIVSYVVLSGKDGCCTDEDGDGYCDTEDCDDTSPDVYPGAPEACDGVDNDCDGQVDEGSGGSWYLDEDGDGFGARPVTGCVPGLSLTAARGDCDDTDAEVHPGAYDVSGDGVDADCGGTDGAELHVGLNSNSLESIQQALSASADGTIIWVGPGSYNEYNIRFGGKHVTLISTHGADATIVNANGRGRGFVFDSSEDTSSVLDGFTITGGSAETGAGIYVTAASPTIYGCVVRDNIASLGGGGMYLANSSAPLSNCTFLRNTTAQDGGGLFLDGSYLTLERCVFQDNVAGRLGGGLIQTFSGNATIANSIFSGNRAAGVGGGIYDGSSLTVENCTLVGNSGKEGGGIFIESYANLTVTNSILAYNVGPELTLDFGFEPVVTYTDFFDLQGDLHNLENLDASNTTVDPAFVRYTPDSDADDDDLHLAPGSPLIDAGSPTTRDPDGSIADQGAYGGPDADFGYYADADHDALYDGWEWANGLDPTVADTSADPDSDGVSNLKELTSHCDPQNADTDGDGATDGDELNQGSDPTRWSSQPGVSGAVPMRVPADFSSIQDAVNAVWDEGEIRVSAGTWQESLTIEGKNISITGIEGAAKTTVSAPGENAVLARYATLSLQGLTITGGDAVEGGGVALVYSDGTLDQVEVTKNKASSNGGGIFVSQSSLDLRSSTISDNTSGEGGGGLAMEDSSGSIQNCDFQGNRASDGGAIYLDFSNPRIEDVTMTGNTVGDDGGAMYMFSSGPSVERVVAEGNQCNRGSGGGMYLSYAYPTVRNSSFIDNTGYNGGGLYFFYDYLYLTDPRYARFENCLIADNTAEAKGGGAYAFETKPTLDNCKFIGNTAGEEGGGLSIHYFAHLTLEFCTITGNSAPDGAGVHLFYSDPSFINTILAYNSGYNLYAAEDEGYESEPVLSYCDLYNPSGSENHNLSSLGTTNQTVEPGFLAYGSDGTPSDLHLGLDSPLVDAGDPATERRDVDGSRSDLGVYGGPLGDQFDLDQDTWPDYFWPGTLSDAPAGFNPASYDCDDADAGVHACP